MTLFALLAAIHLAIALTAITVAIRSRIYPARRLAAQALLALAVPILGAAWVFFMLIDSRPETPKPKVPEFPTLDHQGGDG